MGRFRLAKTVEDVGTGSGAVRIATAAPGAGGSLVGLGALRPRS
jgi:ribosomal protein L11 methylase PrmA